MANRSNYSRFSDGDDGSFTEEERDLIGREAARLRKEFEKERSTSRFTPLQNSNPQNDQFPDVSTDFSQNEDLLNDLDRQVQESLAKKQSALNDLQALQNALRKNKNDLRHSERDLKDAHSKCDNERSEINNLQKQKEELLQQLNELNRAVDSSKKNYDNQVGLNTDEILGIIDERDALRRRLDRGEDTLAYIERLELERQINAANESLSAAEKVNKQKLDGLLAEIVLYQQKLEESESNSEKICKRLTETENEFRECREADEENLLAVKAESRELKCEIDDLKISSHRFELDMAEKNRELKEMQEMLVSKEKEIGCLHDVKSKMGEDHAAEIVHLKDSFDVKVKLLHDQFEKHFDALKEDHNNNEKSIQEDCNKKIEDIKLEFSRVLNAKNLEMENFKEKMRDQEDRNREFADKMRDESKEQVVKAINREKELCDEEIQKRLRKERIHWEDEMKKLSDRMQENIDSEKQMQYQLQKRVTEINCQLESEKMKHQMTKREAESDYEKLKQDLELKAQSNINRVRENLIQERYQENLKNQEANSNLRNEISSKDREIKQLNEKCSSLETLFDHYEKTVVLEINDQCKILSVLLGITPRRVNVDRYDKKNRGLTQSVPHKCPTTDCLANLRACISEIEGSFNEHALITESNQKSLEETKKRLKADVLGLQRNMQREKATEIATVKAQIQDEFNEEIFNLKDDIENLNLDIKDLKSKLAEKELELARTNNSMQNWKEDVANKLAKQFDKEVSTAVHKKLKHQLHQQKSDFIEKQKLLIRLEDQASRLKVERSLSRNGNVDATPDQLMEHLQDRIHQLRAEISSPKSGYK